MSKHLDWYQIKQRQFTYFDTRLFTLHMLHSLYNVFFEIVCIWKAFFLKIKPYVIIRVYKSISKRKIYI